MDKILRPWRHYVDFSGRSTRTEFWLFYIVFYGLIAASFIVTDALFGRGLDDAAKGDEFSLAYVPLILWVLACLLPSIAVTVRRLHDSNKSGWMYLLTLVPYIGFIFFIVFGFLPGTRGENDYGFDPRLGEGAPDFDAPEIFS
ncbi:DUF805 domain-containing protein [Sphingomonas sp.]|uniref:DUF805 domain-containing protein n=1 Tax=Sphingomonas sp. TaxID=28214 RepID=UPI003BA9E6A5